MKEIRINKIIDIFILLKYQAFLRKGGNCVLRLILLRV